MTAFLLVGLDGLLIALPHSGSYSSVSPSSTCLSFLTVRWEKEASWPHFTQMACTLETSSAMAHSPGIGPNGIPRKSISSPATMTRIPLLASWLHTSIRPSSKNCASSMPTTSISEVNSSMLADESIGVEDMMLLSCDTTSASE